MKRSIILFPKFSNIDSIQSIREKYDPLALRIAPHITLVFPFDSHLSTDQLKTHLTHSLRGVKSFNIMLKYITGDYRDGYLFLNVKKGNDQIIELHDKLYSSILSDFLFKKATYCPHITVGKIQDKATFENAIEELGSSEECFETVIDRVWVEHIDDDENSNIEFSLELE